MHPWIQAARPLAHVNILAPLLLGQAAAWHVTGSFSVAWLGAATVWGVLDHLFVIFANEFADRESDTGERTILSGGSGVIQEGKLAAGRIARAARLSAALVMIYSCAFIFLDRGWLPIYGAAALLLVWLYSFPPARLSYRGGGEWLQGVGIGVGLPSLGYYLQTGEPFAPLWLMGPAVVLGVCSNVLTALPDVEGDAHANKRTFPVRHGRPAARRFASAGIAFASFGVFLTTPLVGSVIRAAVATVPLVPLLVGTRAENPLRAAWWSSIAINLLVVLWTLAMIAS